MKTTIENDIELCKPVHDRDFNLCPGTAHAEDAVKVTADNYVRAESDFQMKGYIESFNCFGKFSHTGSPTTLTTR